MTLNALSLGSEGPRIAFLHGLFGQGRNWSTIAKALVEEPGVRALLIDLPDHGRSPWSTEFSYAGYADAVAERLREEGGDDPWTIVGHSLGGKTAMVLTLHHPELVERLAVVDIAPRSYHNLHRFSGYIEGMQAMPLTELDSRREAEDWFAQVEPDAGVRAFLLQNLRRSGSEGWHWQANVELFAGDAAKGGDSVIADFPVLEEEVAAYDGPVVWLNGDDSEYVKSEDEPVMKRLFPRVRQVRVKGADHWVHTAAPDVTIEVLRRFLVG